MLDCLNLVRPEDLQLPCCISADQERSFTQFTCVPSEAFVLQAQAQERLDQADELLCVCRWHEDEASPNEVTRACMWLQMHIAPPGVKVVPMTSSTWLRAEWTEENVRSCKPWRLGGEM